MWERVSLRDANLVVAARPILRFLTCLEGFVGLFLDGQPPASRCEASSPGIVQLASMSPFPTALQLHSNRYYCEVGVDTTPCQLSSSANTTHLLGICDLQPPLKPRLLEGHDRLFEWTTGAQRFLAAPMSRLHGIGRSSPACWTWLNKNVLEGA